jgi:hypothetical protein
MPKFGLHALKISYQYCCSCLLVVVLMRDSQRIACTVVSACSVLSWCCWVMSVVAVVLHTLLVVC